MIGILLALEVSNWNDEKKERALEKELLSGVLNGLESDLEDLTFNKNQHTQILSSQKIVLAWLDSVEPFSDSLKRHLALAHAFTQFISQDGPYETLKINGIQLINDPKLKILISNLYDNVYDIYGELEKLYNAFAMESYTKINAPLFKGTTPYKLGPEGFMFGEMEPWAPEELRKSREFQHQIRTLMVFNELNVQSSMAPTKEKVEQLVGLLKKELEKK